jgi:cytochrome c-type biogenesis protein CcmH/NrfG
MKNETGMAEVIQEIGNAPRFPDAQMYIGNFYATMNRGDQALQEFQNGARAHPGRKRDYQKRIAEVLIALGRKPQAITVIKEVLAGDSGDFDARLILAGLDVDSGKTDRLTSGVATLEALAREKPGDSLVTLNLGKAKLVGGDATGALAAFRSALDVRPNNVEAGCRPLRPVFERTTIGRHRSTPKTF